MTLHVSERETCVKEGKDEARLRFRAVGTESFVDSSSHGEVSFRNDN
jgi:hypothetical protein